MNNEKDQNDTYSTFRYFNKKFKDKDLDTIRVNWLEIKRYHQRFLEWFEEKELYHKIGFLVAIESLTINSLYESSKGLTKSAFREFLDEKIKNTLRKVSLEELQYGDKIVKSVLLLYNILTILKNENDNSYFPFEIYKNENWDIEHITSINETIPDNKKEWLKDAKIFIDPKIKSGSELIEKAENTNINNDAEFEELYKEIIDHFNTYLEDTDVNDISNLSLLDSKTNRGYKNAVFPLKRKTIIDREKNGTFIPLCTKNVFLKYFNDYPPAISFWTQEDRDKYYEDLVDVLQDYLKITKND